MSDYLQAGPEEDYLDGFDASTVDPYVAFEPLPADKYTCIVVSAERKNTKAGTGQLLEVILEVIEGAYARRKVYDRINFDNPSPKATAIGQAQLSSLCRATGVLKPKNGLSFCGIAIVASVGVTKRTDNGELTNEVKGYSSCSSTAAHSANPRQAEFQRQVNAAAPVQAAPLHPVQAPAPAARPPLASQPAPWGRK